MLKKKKLPDILKIILCLLLDGGHTFFQGSLLSFSYEIKLVMVSFSHSFVYLINIPLPSLPSSLVLHIYLPLLIEQELERPWKALLM